MNDGCLDGNMTSSMVLGETMRSGAHFSQSMYGFLDQIPPPIIAAARALKAHIFLTYWGVTEYNFNIEKGKLNQLYSVE